MNWEPQEERSIRQYLLKSASPEEEQTVEERMLREDDYAALVEMIEDEMIDDYARGVMSKGERSQFEKSFAMTPSRKTKLMIAAAAVKQSAGIVVAPVTLDRRVTSRWQWLFAPLWRPVLIASAVLFAGLSVWNFFKSEDLVPRGIAALNQAYKNERPLASRISGFNYAPFSTRLGRNESKRVDSASVDRAERLLRDAVAESPGPAAHHALGRYFLAQVQIDEAISEFELALKENPNDATLHNDIGAAFLEKYRRKRLTGDVVDAQSADASLRHLNRALELDKAQVQALFNRALLRRERELREKEKEDWELYLKMDPSSPWSDEARSYLEEIRK